MVDRPAQTAETLPSAPRIRHDWVSKTLAGCLLGFTLALACSGVFMQINIGAPFNVQAQLAMWMLAPIWMITLGCVYFFRSGKRAWFVLLAANVLVLAVDMLLRVL